jgi:hypothetical protein
MSRGRGVRLSLRGILVAALIAAAITTWAASPIARSNSAEPTQAREVIYRPQHLARLLTPGNQHPRSERLNGGVCRPDFHLR